MKCFFQSRVGFGAVAVVMTVGLAQIVGVGCGSDRDDLTISQDKDGAADDAQGATGGNSGGVGDSGADTSTGGQSAGGSSTGGAAGNGEGGGGTGGNAEGGGGTGGTAGDAGTGGTAGDAGTGGTGGAATGGSGGAPLACDKGFTFSATPVRAGVEFDVSYSHLVGYTDVQMEASGPGSPKTEGPKITGGSFSLTCGHIKSRGTV